MTTESQARAPSGSIVISIRVGSSDWIRHPSAKLDWISALLHSPWSPVAWLLVAEAQHAVATPGAMAGGEACDIAHPVRVIEYVEQTAVQHSVVLLDARLKLQGIAYKEKRMEVSFPGLLFCQLDCLR